ncbi:reprolysin-like metallopeptidase [Kaistella polysaccharea]|uniref:reprolysin-like metallopeptidase n=1 Tax=Kaistella polysaccharea TaxID=2878534 RepID=UPI001CF55D0B|nr:M12 family metallo-peptidase [Kaistella polysaccharea]
MKKKLLSTLLVCYVLFLFGQNVAEKGIPGKIFPFDAKEFSQKLNSVSITAKGDHLLKLPLGDGRLESFSLTENDLTKNRNLSIKTYDGLSKDGKTSLKLSIFSNKINAIIKSESGYYMFEPYQTQGKDYRLYNMFDDMGANVSCGIDKNLALKSEFADIKKQASALKLASATYFPYGNNLRKFRMAIATTGEFTQNFGNQDNALAEALNMLNLINLVFETELSVSFVAINETLNKTLIFSNPTTDPFTVSSTFASATNSQAGFNTLNTNGTLPYSKYDIAHTFHIMPGTGSTAQGQAGPNPCTAGSSARAWSQWTASMPRGATANLIIHEMGHQFSAWHTYNAVGGSVGSETFCTNGWDDTSAVEPGSGTTIMSYANNCKVPVDQTNSGKNQLNYFNAKSLDQILYSLAVRATCFTNAATGNTPPSSNAGADIVIPKNTPFKLKGIATDKDGNSLSYTWEQADVATASDKGAFGYNVVGVGGYTAVNSTTAPLFRSEQTRENTERIFPKLQYILNNNNIAPDIDAEALPQVARNMKFRFTVRDNKIGGGGVDSDEMVIRVDDSGPLKVTSQNTTGITAAANTNLNITWAVNNTQTIKDKVTILLSVDGGYTFPYVLKQDAPNNGVATVTVPNVPGTTKARIKVTALLSGGAEFFDISETNFSITNASCNAQSTIISPTSSVSTVAGNALANLNMTAPTVGNLGYFTTATVDINTTNVNRTRLVTYADESLTTPKYLGSANSVLKRVRVTKTGSYTIANTGAFLIISIYTADPTTAIRTEAEAVASFVTSNAFESSTPGTYSAYGSLNVTLTEGVDYYINFNNFSNGDPAKSYNLTFTGDGSFYEVTNLATTNSNYIFIAVDSNNMIVAQSPTADFRSLVGGTYTIYGLSYLKTNDPNTFVGKTKDEVVLNCALTSDNTRTLILSCVTPVITLQPVAASVKIGTKQIFTVNIANGPATYQWFKDGVAIANQTQNTLTINSVQKADEGSYYVVISNGSCSITSVTVKLTATVLGTIDPDEAEEFILYPNPVKDILNIKTTKSADRIEIYDISGRLIKRQPITSKSISLTGLQNGIFIFKIFNKNEVVKVQKIIKQ